VGGKTALIARESTQMADRDSAILMGIKQTFQFTRLSLAGFVQSAAWRESQLINRQSSAIFN
jgi:inorganic triphosphatase YgiF